MFSCGNVYFIITIALICWNYLFIRVPLRPGSWIFTLVSWTEAVIARVHALIGWESQVDKSRLWEKRRISTSLPSLPSFSNSGLIFKEFTLTNSRWCRKAQRNGWNRERAGGNKAWVTPGKLSPHVLDFLSLAPQLGVENISDTLQNREASLSLYLSSTICLCQQLYMYLECS